MFEIRPYRRNERGNFYDPFREMEALERAFFGRPLMTFDEPTFRRERTFRTDVKDNGDAYLLEADLPGFDKKDIALDLNGDTLTIRAERHSESENEDGKGNYLRVERSYGKFMRSYDVSGVDTAGIKAKYENGVLTLTLPKIQEALPKTTQIAID